MRKFLFAGALLLACVGLAACATREADTWQQQVFGLQADYNALLTVALVYESQPRCAAGQTTLKTGCSQSGVVAEIRRADMAAFAAIEAAQNTVRSPLASAGQITLALTAATNAVGALRKIMTTYGIGPPSS